MKVFVAGASGAIGTALIKHVRAAGHTPIGMIRSTANEPAIRALGAEPVVANGLDRESVVRAIAATQPDIVVHVMTALRGVTDYKNFDRSFEATNRLRTIGTDNLVFAAREAGVKHVLAHSFAGWNYAKGGAEAKRETDPFDSNPPSSQRESLQALIHLEQTILESGIRATVLRCATLYGPGTSIAPDGDLAKLIGKRGLPIIGGGTGIWSFVHVDDAACATVRAIGESAEGVFNIADDEPAAVAAWISELAEILKAPKPLRVPAFIGRWAAGESGMSMMTQVRGASNAKACDVLGWQPEYRTWRQGFRATFNR